MNDRPASDTTNPAPPTDLASYRAARATQPAGRTRTQIRREQALELLARGVPPTEAAHTLGISARTLRRYLQNGALLAELRRMQTERIEALLRASLLAAPTALITLHGIAANSAASERGRVTASRAIIEHTLRLFESADLAQRVERLEDLAETADDPPAFLTAGSPFTSPSADRRGDGD